MIEKLFLFFLLVGVASSSSFTNDEFVAHGFAGRTLLQQKKACPVNWEKQNFTILTSQCKGPHYGKSCCPAFKQFACPVSDQLNDRNTDCDTTMFSYINLHGKYPPGLFSNLCIEKKDGLDCNGVHPPDEAKKNDTPGRTHSSMLMIVAGSLMLLWNVM